MKTNEGERRRPSKSIGRQLAVGFAVVALISVSMCGMLLTVLGELSEVVEHMRKHESSIRGGLSVSTGVREQYIHIAHSLIEGNRSHVPHYAEWVQRLRTDAESLAVGESPEVVRRLDEVVVRSTEMDRLFRTHLLPAAEAGRLSTVLPEHSQAEELSAVAAGHADWVANEAERRMEAAHHEASAAVRAGFTMGGICVVALLLVAIGYTLRLRAVVLRPLRGLGLAAGRFGAGEFGHRVDPGGPGELGEVGRAFNRMAEELADREQRLLSSERMATIGRLAAGVAHEINNPIGIIRGYLKTMLPEVPTDELRNELQILDEEAAACQRLTRDLLTVAIVPDLVLSRVEMQGFLDEAGARLAELPEAQGHALKIEAEAAEMNVDAQRLRQVLANLVGNAAHASAKGTPIVIRGTALPEGDRYEIEVEDQGPGVKLEDRQRIFEPFYSGPGGGSGLGLSVCRSIISAHQGSIEAGSGAHGGALFKVSLPANVE